MLPSRLLRVARTPILRVKTSTGIVGLPVVPNGREVLMSLWTKLDQTCENYGDNPYNAHVRQIAKYIIGVCNENQTVEEIEKALDVAHIELEIEAVEREIDLCKQLNEIHKPWEEPDPEVYAEFLEDEYPDHGDRAHPGEDDGAIHLEDVLAAEAAEAAKGAAPEAPSNIPGVPGAPPKAGTV